MRHCCCLIHKPVGGRVSKIDGPFQALCSGLTGSVKSGLKLSRSWCENTCQSKTFKKTFFQITSLTSLKNLLTTTACLSFSVTESDPKHAFQSHHQLSWECNHHPSFVHKWLPDLVKQPSTVCSFMAYRDPKSMHAQSEVSPITVNGSYSWISLDRIVV